MANPVYQNGCRECVHLGTEEVEGRVMDFYFHAPRKRFQEETVQARYDNHWGVYHTSVRMAEYLSTFNIQPWKTVVRLLAQHRGEQ